jgi:hypothetical protein
MSRRQPKALEYYLDANLDGPELVGRLTAGRMVCHAHRDHYPHDTDDETWIPPIAHKGWVIVTRDLAIQRRPAEREAWTSANAVVIMVRGEALSAEDMATALLKGTVAASSTPSFRSALPR